jgi:hypothetical protein
MNGNARVFPDVVIHRRGPNGPNVLVLELKKTSNPDPHECDRKRIEAFRKHLKYLFGALIQCETRKRHQPGVSVVKWFHA